MEIESDIITDEELRRDMRNVLGFFWSALLKHATDEKDKEAEKRIKKSLVTLATGLRKEVSDLPAEMLNVVLKRAGAKGVKMDIRIVDLHPPEMPSRS